MTFNKTYKIFSLALITFLLKGCVEPYEIETQAFQNMLVVEATITNEFTFQEIKVSQTVPLEEQVRLGESNASVKIVDDAQNVYLFEENEPGIYVSSSKFAAQPNREYHLEIETKRGKSYLSEPTMLVQGTKIDDLKAIRTENPQGEDGVAIILDSDGDSDYYRYEYVETYKIVSNFAILKDLVYVLNEDDVPVLTLVAKTKEERVCYGTDYSSDIVLSGAQSLTENKLDNFLVRFLKTGNPKISHRYSILVKQYAIGSAAYSFYQTMKELAVSENLFSQSQPGFINGNIYAADNPEEKVIGFFSVSSVDVERIFFSFTDFYDPNAAQPSFASNCAPVRPSWKDLGIFITNDNYRFFEESAPPPGDFVFPLSDYVFVPAGCVDCTVFGSNKVPEFWVKD